MTDHDFQFEIRDGRARITAYTGEDPKAVIPDALGGCPVGSLAPESFGFTAAEEVYVPACVRLIEDPDDLSSVRLVIDEKNPYYSADGYGIYRHTEDGRVLSAVSLADDRECYAPAEGTTEILPGALRGCPHLHELFLPASLRTIGENALDTSDGRIRGGGLHKIEVAERNPYFRIEGQALLSDPGQGGKTVLIRYFGSEEDYRIPDCVSETGPRAFRGAKFRIIRIPAGVRHMGEEALKDCVGIDRIILEGDGSEIYVPPLSFRKEEIFSLLGKKEDGLFDYEGYDRLFETYPYTEYRMKMAFCRFDSPAGLEEEARQRYRAFISGKMEKVLKSIAEKHDCTSLQKLMQYGFLTEENIHPAIEFMSRAGDPMMLELLMQYKFGHFRESRSDMEL